MKLKKHTNTSKPNKPDKSNKSEKKPLSQMIKADFIKLCWIALYMMIIFIIVYVVYSILPIMFSYVYSATGLLIGIDFTSMSNADLTYWALISLSVGAVIAAFVVILLYKAFGAITKKIIGKHVLKKSKGESLSDGLPN